MKEIPLTQGKVAIVDDEDYEALTEWKWYYNQGYAVRKNCEQNGKRGVVLMHRIILNTPLGYDTDHVNGNGLDNRKENLRVATKTQNQYNVGKRVDNTSGHKGVSWYKAGSKWRAYIIANTKFISLGYFKDKNKAARAYNETAIKLHGEFALLNSTIRKLKREGRI